MQSEASGGRELFIDEEVKKAATIGWAVHGLLSNYGKHERQQELREAAKEDLPPVGGMDATEEEPAVLGAGLAEARAAMVAEDIHPEMTYDSKETISTNVERASKLYEELYDANPDKFGSMLTADFLGIVHDLENTQTQIENTRREEGDIEREIVRMLADQIEQKRAPTDADLRNIKGSFVRKSFLLEGVLPDAPEIEAKEAALEATFWDAAGDLFELSPKARLERVKALFVGLQAEFAKKRRSIEAEKQKFLDSHKPDPNPELSEVK